MIVTCPQCATQYNLADSAVRHGAKARCAQCKTIFVLRVQIPQAQPTALPQVAPHVQTQPQAQPIQAQELAPQVQQPQQSQQLGLTQQQATLQAQRQQSIVADGLPPLSPPPQHSQSMGPLGAPSFMQGSAFTAEQGGVVSPVPSAPLSMYQGVATGEAQAAASLPTAQGAEVPQSSQMSPSLPSASSGPSSPSGPCFQYAQPFQDSAMGMSSAQDLATLTGQANLARRPSHTEGYADGHNASKSQRESTVQRSNEPTAFQSFMTGLLLLVILGMLGYGAWRYMPRLGNAQLEAEANRIGHVSEQIKDISLHNVQQYTVKSNKAGLLLVLEGRVINNFRSPREMVKVEAALYDKDGNRLESKQQLCGVLLSKLQMQIWDASEIEAALDNELEAYAHNVNIASGTSVPFMVVFVDPPASAVSYGVHVIDAQIPPTK